MAVALDQARQAADEGEVPVGAAVYRLSDGVIVAAAHNRRETDADPTAHAEVLALRAAAHDRGVWRLEGYGLAVTLEPCPMCAGRPTYCARFSRRGAAPTDRRSRGRTRPAISRTLQKKFIRIFREAGPRTKAFNALSCVVLRLW